VRGEREEESRPARLGSQERKERGKRKERVGRAQLEIKGEKELHLKFKFKWKANNKTMQYGMECTKPIFPYILFYGYVNYY
jgi:hypothetical protein